MKNGDREARGNDEEKDVPVKDFNYYNEPTRNTTLVLSQKHYNFLKSVQHHEMKLGRVNTNMSYIVKEALNKYEEYYAKEHNVKIDEKGFVKS